MDYYMKILGIIKENKLNIYINNQKVNLNDLFIYFEGDIFNKDRLFKKYKLQAKKEEELIKYLYKHEKTNFVKKLDGEFLIVIYDK